MAEPIIKLTSRSEKAIPFWWRWANDAQPLPLCLFLSIFLFVSVSEQSATAPLPQLDKAIRCSPSLASVSIFHPYLYLYLYLYQHLYLYLYQPHIAEQSASTPLPQLDKSTHSASLALPLSCNHQYRQKYITKNICWKNKMFWIVKYSICEDFLWPCVCEARPKGSSCGCAEQSIADTWREIDSRKNPPALSQILTNCCHLWIAIYSFEEFEEYWNLKI